MSDELGPGERWEWGVKHNQGIRREPSEKSARASLEWLTASFERTFRNTVKPQIVRRRVSDWQPVNATPQSGDRP